MNIWTWLLAALGHSIGWGIRGNFGHETGAMMAGALGTLGAVLLTRRPDWHRRAAVFGVLGAVGWSWGGSISYMQVVAYTHSGHWPSQLYGFFALYTIGFLWGAPGGTGFGIAATWTGRQLADLFKVMTAVFAAWFIQSWVALPWLLQKVGKERFRELTNWYDTDFIAAGVAVLVLAVWSIPKSHRNAAARLGWFMALGWWAGFLLLVNVLGLRMTPPRGDNWAGCLGMTAGIFVWARREGMPVISLTTLASGLAGGLSFAFAPVLKLSLAEATGLTTNWHSVMEQSTGLMNGLGVALTCWLANRATADREEQPEDNVAYFWQAWCVVFIWILITWLNLWKNAEEWVKQGAMAAKLYDISVLGWLAAGYAGLTVTLVALLWRHARRPMALVPGSAMGKGQWIYLVFLWWICIGNFDRAQVKFGEERLITEGVIFVNAMICTGLLLVAQPGLGEQVAAKAGGCDVGRMLRRFAQVAVILTVVGCLADFAIIRGIYGDQFAGHASLHIRFGPRSTVKTGPK